MGWHRRAVGFSSRPSTSWIALTYCILPKGERRSSAQVKDPGHCRSSEIDLSRVLVQQHYVIGYCAGLLPTLFMGVGPLIAPSCSGFTTDQISGNIERRAPENHPSAKRECSANGALSVSRKAQAGRLNLGMLFSAQCICEIDLCAVVQSLSPDYAYCVTGAMC